MAVNLSPVGGAAAQFFDNNGIPLAGGLLYTYAAGTSTPLATYTTQQATILNSNPIVLDSAGRVPNEIWLTSTYAYKFVLTNSLGAQVWSYDNLVGINSNFTAYSLQEQTFTATQGQTVFTLTGISYVPGTNNLSVFVNGSKQIVTTNYLETSSTVVTFLTGLNVGDVVDFITAISTSTTATSSNNISYTQGGTGSITTNVQAKLQQTVSVKDFGAVGDGTTNDTAAIQAALNTGNSVYFPKGTYVISSALTPISNQKIYGAGQQNTIISQTSASSNGFTIINKSFVELRDMTVQNTASTPTGKGIYIQGGGNCFVTQILVQSFFHGFNFNSTGSLQINRCYSTTNLSHGFLLNTNGSTASVNIWIRDCYSTANTGDGIAVVGLVTGIYLDTLELALNTANGLEFVVDGSGAPSNFFCTKLVFDANGQSGCIINSGVSQCYFNNCWSSNRGTGYNFYSLGTEIQINGGFFYNCNKNGIDILGPYNSVVGASIHNAGVNTANTYDGIYANAAFPTISGCSIYSGNSGASDKTRYAINLGSSVTNGAITGNNVLGVFGSPKIYIGTTDQTTLLNILNNTGFSNPSVIASEFGSTYGSTTVTNGSTATLTTLDSVNSNGNYLLFIGQNSSSNGGINALAQIRRGSSSSTIYTIHATSGIALSMSGQNVQLTNTVGGDLNADWSLVKFVANGIV